MRLVIIHFYSLFKHGSGSAAAVAACLGYEAALFPRVLKVTQTQSRLLVDKMWFIRHRFTKNSSFIQQGGESLCNICFALSEELCVWFFLLLFFYNIIGAAVSVALVWKVWVRYRDYECPCSIILHLELTYRNQLLAHAQYDSIGYSTLTGLCVRTAKTTTGWCRSVRIDSETHLHMWNS